jgi:hypothetical protein
MDIAKQKALRSKEERRKSHTRTIDSNKDKNKNIKQRRL